METTCSIPVAISVRRATMKSTGRFNARSFHRKVPAFVSSTHLAKFRQTHHSVLFSQRTFVFVSRLVIRRERGRGERASTKRAFMKCVPTKRHRPTQLDQAGVRPAPRDHGSPRIQTREEQGQSQTIKSGYRSAGK